jgi:SPP1 family predicted phage head-tail adaptor
MTRKLNRTDFKGRALFGVVKSVRNKNSGAYRDEFVESFSLFYAPVRRTLKMKVEIEGTKYEGTRAIYVRHTTQMNDVLKVQIDKVIYDVVEIDSDETGTYESFDIIMLRKVGK